MALKGYFTKGIVEAGCDEAGRGSLAGRVYAAAVVLPPGWNHPWLNDSKQITETRRMVLRQHIEQDAIDWAVAWCEPEEIDRFNILQASILAMHKAIANLKQTPEALLIDGNRFRPYLGIPHNCIIRGDSLYRSIAAASILAKTWRDDYMTELHQQFPEYGWLENKGYPTRHHRDAVARLGASPFHRVSFRVDGCPIGTMQHSV